MLVFEDGSQVGTLGGGCVEAEVKRRALTQLATGGIELLSFELDNDYGWDDGLICGGRMRMLVDPLRPGDEGTYYHELLRLFDDDRSATEVTVIEGKKAGGRDADRWLLDEQGRVVASRHAGSADPSAPSAMKTDAVAPAELFSKLRPLATRPRPYIEAGLSYLPHLKRCRLIIVGAGHIGQKVAELAADVDFDVWVVDDRQEYCNGERFPAAKRLIVDAFDDAIRRLEVDRNTYCIIVTRGHNHDEQALLHLVETEARYVGMIGSRRKIKLIFDDLIREGISTAALSRVFAPLGIDIGSQSVPEIAVSIVADLIAHRNLGQLPDRIRPASVLTTSPLTSN